MSIDTPLLEVCSLTARRGGTRVLEGVSLSIAKGSPFAITGTSGAGKTTLLFAIAGLIPIESGTVTVSNKALTTLSARERARTIGLVFQDYQLFPHLTVIENVMLAPRFHALTGALEIAQALLSELRIESLAQRYPHELSGGQKQRVAIARSLILSPQVLLLDEPTAALDTSTSEELAHLLVRLNARSQIIIVSHDLVFLKLVCPRSLMMENGTIVCENK